MGPDRYLREVVRPVSEVVAEICDWEGFDPKFVLYKSTDVRETLKRLKDRLFEKRKTEEDREEADRLERIRQCIQWLNIILNTYAHDANAKSEIVAISFASSLEILRVNAGFTDLPAFSKLDEYREALYREIFGEHASPTSEQTVVDAISAQIDALHEKIDQLKNNKHPSGAVAQASFAQKLSKRDALEKIREEISGIAAERGMPLEGYQHLLQWKKLDELIADRPSNVDELKSWARVKLNSYQQNQRIIDRQIERWGERIIEVIL